MLALKEVRRIEGEGLHLLWSGGAESFIPNQTLRKECPCASCREARGEDTHAAPLTSKKSSLRVISHSAEEQLQLKKIWPVGNYALGVEWADGHSTGIYPFELLQQLGQKNP